MGAANEYEVLIKDLVSMLKSCGLEGLQGNIVRTVNNDKQKLLCLLKIPWMRTDRQHILNSLELIRILQDEYQCSCDRRTIYSTVDALIYAGFKIKQVKGNTHGYFMEEWVFQPSGNETARGRSTILQNSSQVQRSAPTNTRSYGVELFSAADK